MIDSMFAMLKSFLWWLIVTFAEWIYPLFDPLWESLEDVIPEDLAAKWNQLKPYISAANEWIPLDLGMTLIGAYYTFSATYTSVKWILKRLPFVGG